MNNDKEVKAEKDQHSIDVMIEALQDVRTAMFPANHIPSYDKHLVHAEKILNTEIRRLRGLPF